MGTHDSRGRITVVEPDLETGTLWVRTNDPVVARGMRKAWYPETRRGKWSIFSVPMPEEMLEGAGERPDVLP